MCSAHHGIYWYADKFIHPVQLVMSVASNFAILLVLPRLGSLDLTSILSKNVLDALVNP